MSGNILAANFLRLEHFEFIVLTTNLGNTNRVANINLNISRAYISSSKCCIPSCKKEYPDKLHRIPRAIRCEIMKNKRFFIPEKSVACNFHNQFSVLSEMTITNENSPFTANQIEEMVDLLRSDVKPSKDMVQGKLLLNHFGAIFLQY